MRTTKKTILISLLISACLLSVGGCGKKKADQNKPISEVKAEAEKMSAGDLRAMAISYRDSLLAKKAEVDKIKEKITAIPVTEALGKEAKALKEDLETLQKTASALQERFTIYYNKLKEKGGDLSGLDI